MFYCIKILVRVYTLKCTPHISIGPLVCVASSQITSAHQTWIEINNIFKDALNTDIDNHTETHCSGKNFRPLSWSDLMCSVSPFLFEYTTTDNVEICTAVTTWTSHTGKVYIIVFGKCLFFGYRMDSSLINPNKCRSYSISPCNDPADPHRALRFQTNKLNISLFMKGKISIMYTRCPSKKELQSCQYIYLSDQEIWDPSNVNFKIMSMEEESRNNIASRSIFDITMTSISSELCEDTLSASLVSAVNVHSIKPALKSTIPGTPLPTPNIAAITHERNHKLTPKSIAQKWNIGLNMAQKMIKVTTQL